MAKAKDTSGSNPAASGWAAPAGGTPAPGTPASTASTPVSSPPPPPLALGGKPLPPPTGTPTAPPTGAPSGSNWKPGIMPLRPLNFGEFLDIPVKAIRHNPKTMLMVPAIVQLITTSLAALLSYEAAAAAFNFDYYYTSEGPQISPGAYLNVVLGVFIVSLSNYAMGVMLTVSAARSILGEKVSPSYAFKLFVKRFWGLLGLGLMIAGMYVGVEIATAIGSFIPILGSFAGLLLITWFVVRVQLSAPALLLERVGPVEALRRGFRLSRTRQWNTIGVVIVADIILSVITLALFVIPFVIALSFAGGDTGSVAIAITISLAFAVYVSAIINTPYFAALVATIYTDQRIRLEGLDLDLAEAARIRESGGA